MNHIDYIEKEKHGTAVFPIQYYYVDKTHSRYTMNAHWHREFEFLRVLSGNLTVYLDNKEFALKSGDILLINCACLHRAQPLDCVYECIVVDLTMLLHPQNHIVNLNFLQIINSHVNIENVISANHHDLYNAIVDLFSTLSREEPYYEMLVYGLLFVIFSKAYSYHYISYSKHKQKDKQIEAVNLVLSWLNQNFKEPVNSKKISQICNLNFNYFCKVFKNLTGQTITQYVNTLRIERACHDISENNKSITESAFSNGFNDLSYFTKIFKRQKGITPREYKDSVQKR